MSFGDGQSFPVDHPAKSTLQDLKAMKPAIDQEIDLLKNNIDPLSNFRRAMLQLQQQLIATSNSRVIATTDPGSVYRGNWQDPSGIEIGVDAALARLHSGVHFRPSFATAVDASPVMKNIFVKAAPYLEMLFYVSYYLLQDTTRTTSMAQSKFSSMV